MLRPKLGPSYCARRPPLDPPLEHGSETEDDDGEQNGTEIYNVRHVATFDAEELCIEPRIEAREGRRGGDRGGLRWRDSVDNWSLDNWGRSHFSDERAGWLKLCYGCTNSMKAQRENERFSFWGVREKKYIF